MTWRERWEAFADYLLILWLAIVEAAQWLSDKSAEWPPLSWVIHAVFAIPLALIHPWCPAAVFGYRELEQALHAHILSDAPLTRPVLLDRVMDVLAPAFVGWWLG